MAINFGPAGLGPVNNSIKNLKDFQKFGFKACEIAFTYGVYIKKDNDLKAIGENAKELGISLSIHAPYYLNLNSEDATKKEQTKKRILECCKAGEILGAKIVVFHPGYYGKKSQKETFEAIKNGILELKEIIKKNKWKINIAPETMGKVNVFGSFEQISRLVKETGCLFCLDFAHILAKEKKIDYEKIKNEFKDNSYWHCHFSGIEYGEAGEKRHIKTTKKAWLDLLENLPKNKNITIINESPDMINDSIEGVKLYKNLHMHD
jgi:deoxyribonuclease-4